MADLNLHLSETPCRRGALTRGQGNAII